MFACHSFCAKFLLVPLVSFLFFFVFSLFFREKKKWNRNKDIFFKPISHSKFLYSSLSNIEKFRGLSRTWMSAEGTDAPFAASFLSSSEASTKRAASFSFRRRDDEKMYAKLVLWLIPLRFAFNIILFFFLCDFLFLCGKRRFMVKKLSQNINLTSCEQVILLT